MAGSDAKEKFRNSIAKVRLCKALNGKGPTSAEEPSPLSKRLNRDKLRNIIKSVKDEVKNDWQTINMVPNTEEDIQNKTRWRAVSTITSKYYIGDISKLVSIMYLFPTVLVC